MALHQAAVGFLDQIEDAGRQKVFEQVQDDASTCSGLDINDFVRAIYCRSVAEYEASCAEIPD